MTPEDFISKWSPGGGSYGMGERAGAQPHFIDLCRLLGVDSPDDADNYTFEKGTLRLRQKRAFADVAERMRNERREPPERVAHFQNCVHAQLERH